MAETVLGGVLEFFKGIGIYDVVLPFLLVFTITFAILEKTKVFGTEPGPEGKGTVTRKNLNSMVSFVIAFLVVASSKLVETITKVSSQIVVLLLLVVFFLVLVGTFYSEKDIKEKGVTLEGGMRILFFAIMLIGTAFIFLDAIKTPDGHTWLEIFIGVLAQFTTNTMAAAVILLILIIVFMVWITKPAKKTNNQQG
ncbi:hypothetical protein DRJ22_00200 [Candidatus Woesearchaeota archaeon]|nr:MAG: hypothetical protein DRJ22_00200 [Candidatus Woesearchaeota archaeon]